MCLKDWKNVTCRNKEIKSLPSTITCYKVVKKDDSPEYRDLSSEEPYTRIGVYTAKHIVGNRRSLIPYNAGFHVFATKDDAIAYITEFYNQAFLKVIPVTVKRRNIKTIGYHSDLMCHAIEALCYVCSQIEITPPADATKEQQ